MRNRRLILIGLVVVVAGIAAALLLPRLLAPGGDGEEAEPTPTPANMTKIVLSAQDMTRGQQLSEDAVILQDWPVDSVPLGAITSLEDAYGMIAKVDIPRGMPVTESMVSFPGSGALIVGEGSQASWMIPEGKVAYALPFGRYNSVAWAIRPGDHVDILLSALMIELDEEFQTPLPNQLSSIGGGGEGEEGTTMTLSGPAGRFEVLPNGVLVNVTPNGPQNPRMITQLTVQDAVVLRVGDWQETQTTTTETGGEGGGEGGDGAQGTEGQAAQGEEPVEQQAPAAERSITLAVTRQEAAILEYAYLNKARLTLVLRPAGEEGPVSTESVTLQYLFDRYGLDMPTKLPYGFTPPVQSIDPIR
jgi:pilus assembly protein CpaB